MMDRQNKIRCPHKIPINLKQEEKRDSKKLKSDHNLFFKIKKNEFILMFVTKIF